MYFDADFGLLMKLYMKMKKYILFAVLILSLSLYAEEKDKTVAKVGKRSISSSEFLDRFEMTPWNKEIRSIPSNIAKEQFLYTLVAEKLWAQKAVALGFDTSAAVKENLKSLEKLFVKDALYRLEIMNKVNVTEKDMRSAYYKAHTRLSGDFLTSDSQKEINDLYKALKSGVNFDTLFAARKSGGIADTLTIFLGKFDQSLEDSLYNMKPGKFTSPVNYFGAWYIIRVKNIHNITPHSSQEENSIMKETARILKDRQTSYYYNEFIKNFFAGKKTSINGKILQTLASEIITAIQEKSPNRPISDSNKVYLDSRDFTSIRNRLGRLNLLKAPLIKFDDHSSTVIEFLDNMHYDENAFTTSDANKIKGIIESKLKSFMESEYLVIEGYKRGLQNLPEIKNQLQVWKDSYMYLTLRNSLNDSLKVSDQEVIDYYNKRKTFVMPAEVNIVEVLTDNLNIVEKVLDEYSKGTDMHDLAKKYSKREMTKNSNGEFGLFPVTDYGEIGRIAGTMNVGDVYGPLKVPEGYSVFKLIDKKQSGLQDDRPFAEVKENLKKTLWGMKNFHGLVDYTVKLAKEYGVTIDKEVLNSINVTNIFSVMYRYMGFGGKILAAPLTSPNTEWVQPWLDSKPVNP